MENKPLRLKGLLFINLLGIVLVPILLFYISISTITGVLKNSEEAKVIDNGWVLAKQAANVVEQNFHRLGDYENFTAQLKPFIEEKPGRLVIQDLEDTILYDSSIQQIGSLAIRDTNYLQKNSVNFNISFLRIGTSFFSNFSSRKILESNESFVFWFPYSFDIIQNGKKVAKGTLLLEYGSEATKIMHRAIALEKYITWAILISLVVTVLILSKTIDKKLLKPLAELNTAARKMTQEDFNHPIAYQSENEMGEFCNQFQEMRDQLAESRRRLVKDSIARKVLIGNIAHDLRTPITSIKGYVEGLIDRVAVEPEEQEKYYQVIKDKTEQLDFLINDLFTFSQLELGQLKINCRRVNSLELFQGVLQSNHNINICLDKSVSKNSVDLNIDEKQIRRVIRNILENSLKFGASEIIIFTCLMNDYLRINIKDNGIGISADIKDRIFDRFFTLVPKGASKAGGAGMGLAICKEIIGLHGGEISTGSEDKTGVTIYFTLPIAKES